MFSTTVHVETIHTNVENMLENRHFAWKNQPDNVEKMRNVENSARVHGKSRRSTVQCRVYAGSAVGKIEENMRIKIFYLWKNMWKVLQTV